MRSPRLALATVLLAFLVFLLSACGSTEQPTQGRPGALWWWPPPAPALSPHAPDYDPKPSDLAKVGTADYVLYAPFDSFAPRLKEAAGGHAKTVELNLENTPKTIDSEVTRLGQVFHPAPNQ